ncbi:cytochrome P450 2L1-like [Penaeus japonicus]|uniref:cytochrome P450 2L1-like n=1 Tax=Penaeus japonicus TaxID=27405 RepID=UPI001C70DDE2|nr:cytochrome P450 2L1-like [Penaeus japonicus]XP_042888423.1 cytochrome P450 2L1-like [Penaeus japonicus]XP_042888424.1 cytochrome P450 2L1-like [Penaeus japonicus]XP_042888425.1 cytochrome P450 2L1-like [Penaeus japonicus]XP_042888427.1 cytochrome P450 2L1-like [Penaeus japonicus]
MLTIFLVTILVILAYWSTRKPKDLPPGRWGLPLVGYLPSNIAMFGDVIKQFKKDYGNIFTWRLGSRVVVGLNDYPLIKSVYQMPQCQGRPDFFTFNIFTFNTNSGLVFSEGRVWHEGRRFALRHLKDFGLGKTSMEEIIQREAQELVAEFRKADEKPFEISWSLNVAVLNVIWRIVADRRYSIHDPEILRFSKMVSTNLDIIQGPASFLDIFPWLSHVAPTFVLNKWMKIDVLNANLSEFYTYVMDIINEHKQTMDANYPRDLIDTYLSARKDEPAFGAVDDDINLFATISDLFGAGSETTSSTTRWVLLLMALHPDVQARVQAEIDEVVSRDRPPSLQDREKMPYTDAMLLETLRYSSLLPVSLFHSTTEEVKVAGYTIPKGTLLMANAEGCHRDPTYWEKPDEFYPEHFLDPEGRLITKKDGFLPFSSGRRQCLGESLARMELFLFVSAILQSFTIKAPEGVTLTAEKDKNNRLFNTVKPYKIVFANRK